MKGKLRIDEDLSIGDGEFLIIAGPCSIENMDQMRIIGSYLKEKGVKVLRGGIFKPRTNPDSFQGLGLKGLEILKAMKEEFGFKIVSEIMDPRDIEIMYDYVDIFQVGTRNMQNYSLLKELGRMDKPVMLKRGMSATIEEWINSARYIEKEGNNRIIMCERGIRTFESYTRNTLDLMSVPIIKNKTDYPVIVDPSHGTGRRELVLPASLAARALEADGIMVEIHPEPDKAYSDGQQSLDFKEFDHLMDSIKNI